MTFDWKFLLTALLALAGAVVPVWLWSIDLNSNAINITLKSSVALQLGGNSAIPDLRIIIGDVIVEQAYLSTLEIVNVGAKPIPSSNFEGPMEISSSNSTKILRARVSSSQPVDLKASVNLTKEKILIAPLLLNPKDTFTLAILTSGDQPSFSASSRIAGVSRILFEDGTAKSGRWKVFVFYFPMAFLSAVVYFTFTLALFEPMSLPLSRAGNAIIIITSLSGSTGLLKHAYNILDIDRGHYTHLTLSGIIVVLGISTSIYLFTRKRYPLALR
jgi:hypothetical protein